MTTRRLILAIAIWILAATLVFVLWQYAFAQRRTVQPQHWIPLIRQEQEPATPIANMGLIYVDPNGDACYKDIDGKKSIFAGDNVTYNFTTMTIDTNVIYVDAENDTIGFFTNSPSASAGIQYTDKMVICGTFTSAGVNACIDALGSEGGIVFLPEGEYAITTQVTYDYDNTTIIGETGTIFKMQADVHGIFADSLDNVRLYNVEIDGENYAQTNNFLAYFFNCETSLIKGCTFYDFSTRGVGIGVAATVTRSNNGTIENCTFRNASDTSSYALTIGGDSSYMCTTNVINCTFSQCNDGIFYQNGQHLILGCSFVDNTDDAIYSNNTKSNCNYSRVTNCFFANNDGNDIALLSNTPIGWIIANNIFYGNDDISVYLTGFNHTVKNNLFYEPRDVTRTIYVVGYNHIISGNNYKLESNDTDYCIYFDIADGCVVSNNNFDSSADTATVYMTSSDTGNVFYGNQNLTFSGSGRVYGVFEVAGPIRTYESEWYVADHHDMAGMDPGASGATWTDPSAGTTLGGMQLNAAGETLTFATDCHSDWDGASDIEIKVVFEVNVDNSGGDPNDTVDIKVISYFKGSEETTLKTQTNEVATVVGQSAQYKQWVATILIDYDDGSNPIDAGDKFRHILNLETDTSEVDDIIVNHIHSRYKTKQVHVEI